MTWALCVIFIRALIIQDESVSDKSCQDAFSCVCCLVFTGWLAVNATWLNDFFVLNLTLAAVHTRLNQWQAIISCWCFLNSECGFLVLLWWPFILDDESFCLWLLLLLYRYSRGHWTLQGFETLRNTKLPFAVQSLFSCLFFLFHKISRWCSWPQSENHWQRKPQACGWWAP